MSGQLPLGLQAADHADFESYYAGPNRPTVDRLRRWLDDPRGGLGLLLGELGSGRSHLLQAACTEVSRRDGTCVYLPLDVVLGQFSPDALLGLESVHLIAVDDLPLLAAAPAWQDALNGLISRVIEGGGRILVSGRPDMALSNPGLNFRLGMATVWPLQMLADDDKLGLLQERARIKGMKMPRDVARYLLRHHPGDLPHLMRLLDALDYASLAAKRRLTVPFVSTVLRRKGRRAG